MTAADPDVERLFRCIAVDTHAVENRWTHIGRLWTNGEPYLAMDSGIRHRWLGFSQDEYFDRIVELGPDETGIMVGEQLAAVIGADGVVRDDSWMEVFESSAGTIAIVQASGEDYPHTLAVGLRYAEDPADPCTQIDVSSGELAIFSAACDGSGEHSMTLLPARVGDAPTKHGKPSREPDTGLLLTARSTTYRVTTRSYTELDDSSCFARWLLTPHNQASAEQSCNAANSAPAHELRSVTAERRAALDQRQMSSSDHDGCDVFTSVPGSQS